MARSSKPFQFKEFRVEQDRCAMKIGTDGVTLGAWFQGSNAGRLLDIGCGTGVIALMIAQRYPQLNITALEIDKDAAWQAESNVQSSPWKGQIEVLHQDFNDYKPNFAFDFIVSNPPFFKGETLPESNNRAIARHSGSLTIERLLSHTDKISSETGRFNLIWPIERLDELKRAVENSNWNLLRECKVRSNPAKNYHRVMVELGKESVDAAHETLTIETLERHKFTSEYSYLLKDYLTIF